MMTSGDEYQIFKLSSLEALISNSHKFLFALSENLLFFTSSASARHLLNNLDVGRFGSTYTIMNANDGTIIVNTTNQLADFYTRWNQSSHEIRMLSLILIIKSFFFHRCRVPFVTCCTPHANAEIFIH
jgi:hypothetical protein